MNESIGTSENVSDKEAISEIIYAWVYHRNRGNWDELRDTFWPEGTISISWFDGHFEQFVASLKEMSEKGNPTKHIVAQPFIKINGNRAVSEADCTLFVRGGVGPFDSRRHRYDNGFIDGNHCGHGHRWLSTGGRFRPAL